LNTVQRQLPLPAILLVADLFHPFDDLTVELFLNGDVHTSGVESNYDCGL
jgi:hypothetical protein